MQPSKRSIEKGNDNTVILEGIMIYVNGVEDVEAQFTYNGSSVSVNYSDGSYQRGFLSIWQVSDFKDSSVSSITVDGVYYARVKSSANFHYKKALKRKNRLRTGFSGGECGIRTHEPVRAT